jgi:hypothetical protein
VLPAETLSAKLRIQAHLYYAGIKAIVRLSKIKHLRAANMDETEESTIPRSESRVARLLLGATAGFFGVLMFIITPGSPSPASLAMFGMFCVFIALACATQGRVRQFFGSVIASMVLGLTLYYLWVAGVGDPVTTDRPILLSLLSLLSAMPYFVCFGLPSAAYVVSARFGFARQPQPVAAHWQR